jgi:hypothetical protein
MVRRGRTERRAARPRRPRRPSDPSTRIAQAACDQPPVPARQRPRAHHENRPRPSRQQAAQRREKQTIGFSKVGPLRLTPQNRDSCLKTRSPAPSNPTTGTTARPTQTDGRRPSTRATTTRTTSSSRATDPTHARSSQPTRPLTEFLNPTRSGAAANAAELRLELEKPGDLRGLHGPIHRDENGASVVVGLVEFGERLWLAELRVDERKGGERQPPRRDQSAGETGKRQPWLSRRRC